jgi:hypothetical protein
MHPGRRGALKEPPQTGPEPEVQVAGFPLGPLTGRGGGVPPRGSDEVGDEPGESDSRRLAPSEESP